MPQLQLEGEVDQRDEVIESLQADVERLRGELRLAKQKDSEATRAIAALRRQLSPLYQALQAVFGEIGAITDEAIEAPSSPKRQAWELWKQKLSGYPAKFIDALLAHGDLDSRQLSITTGCHYTNVAKVIYKLNQAGLINKNGNRYSLKEL